MAEDFIEDIYRYSKIIEKLKDGIRFSRTIRGWQTKDIYNDVYHELCDVCVEIMDTDFRLAGDLSKNVIKMSEFIDDMMLLSDHVTRNVIPLLIEWLAYYSAIDVDLEDYKIVSSDVGYLTLKDKSINKYIHSTCDPMEEARLYVERVFNPAFSEYILWGCGMGYYAYQLYMISDGSINITIYERDSLLVELAMNYGVLSWIPKESINVVVDENANKFLTAYNPKQNRAVFHLAEIESIKEKDIKESVMSRYVEYNTIALFKNIVDINVHRNIQADLPDATICLDQIKSDAVIVAAGPSLDENMDTLRKWKGEKTIIAVNTIFRKLIENDIKPDFVVALDASENMYKHLQGVENEDVPAILDLGVYWKWTHEYKGPKYIAYSTRPNIIAENYINENKKELWLSGGTVTFLALEVAIRGKANNIYLVGADFGYPNGNSHAAGTAYAHKVDESDMFEVEAVDGGTVVTDRIMNMYRNSLEKRIMQVKNCIKVYNLSHNGAKIHGTIEV